MPEEQSFLQGSEIGSGLLGDAFKGKGFSSVHHIMEGTDDGQGGMMMVGNGDTVAVD
jgi:hypothetical protein